MFEELKKILGFGPKVDYAELVSKGATIIDVRTKQEYSGGHIRGSVNIPVDRLGNSLNKIKDKSRPVITCCASGVRSSSAKRILISNGYSIVHNGGGWQSLKNKIK
jgi:rhodanese-related sulfurtransferase